MTCIFEHLPLNVFKVEDETRTKTILNSAFCTKQKSRHCAKEICCLGKRGDCPVNQCVNKN